ncbi:MAG: hypothetical protein WC588_03850 [Candidatus Micrarchaeia archaeon]
MLDGIALAAFCLDLASLLLAAYLLWEICPLVVRGSAGSFSRILNAMFVTTVIFCLFQVIELFRLASLDWLEILSPVLSFLLMLVLVFAVMQIKRGILAHDLLVRRKFK